MEEKKKESNEDNEGIRRTTDISLEAKNLRDFEKEIAKIKILEAAYDHIRVVKPGTDAISFTLSFTLSF